MLKSGSARCLNPPKAHERPSGSAGSAGGVAYCLSPDQWPEEYAFRLTVSLFNVWALMTTSVPFTRRPT